jgi:hypothetical protein
MPTKGWREEVSAVNCKKVRWLLALYDSGELGPKEQEMVETHLASCEKCRQELARLSEVPALIQSLHGDTWWADVSSPVMERLNASKAQSGSSQAKPIKTEKKGVLTETPIWRPVRINSLAVAIMERPIWQPVLISLLAVIIIVAAGLAVMHPWIGNNIAQAAGEAARNNSQVQTILGEGEIETEVVVVGEIAHVKCSIQDTFADTFVTAVVETMSMTVVAIHTETTTLHPPEPPMYRPELTEEEMAEAIAIAEANPYIQKILSHGFAMGEPSNSHAALGADPRRVVWLPLEGDTATGDVRGVIVNLDGADVTVMWGGDLPSWWPY